MSYSRLGEERSDSDPLIGVMARLSSQRKLSAHSLDIDNEERNPVHQAAREVVGALVENHWSLYSAAILVALRRLCEAVADEAVECDAGVGGGVGA
ncbi:MAG: hypothetical protein ACLP0J_17960 [Solirubrobacteraceae bacterium]|jgi:hypothetical protein